MNKSELVNQGLQDFIFTSKYARWIPELKRRETWDEAVDRVCNMHLQKYSFLQDADKEQIKWAFSLVKERRVLPSMRSMQFGGKAQLAHECRGYNCCVRHIDSIRGFAEIAYLMLCGCGTGIGLSKRFLARLPSLVGAEDKTGTVIAYVIEDTIEGWADSIEALLQCYFKNNAYSGRKIIFDYSKIRRKGSLLKTGGSRAPGYKPLKAAHLRIKKLLDHIIEEENVKVMRPIHAYDVLMHFADAVLSGGIRRTASSIIFELEDDEMMNAKTYFAVEKFRESVDEETNNKHLKVWVKGRPHDIILSLDNSFDKFTYEQITKEKIIGWKYIEPQRARSNNSVLLLRDKTTKEQFRDIIGKTRQFGEPGFVFADNKDMLFNPCFEIGFLSVDENHICGVQFCNLASINGDKINNKDDLFECVNAQTIIGTCQAGFTNFKYLSHVSKQLTEEEALLGNSMTGVLSTPDILLDNEVLEEASGFAVEVNRKWAKKLNINPAARVTALKPEGTGSLAIGVHAPGIHPVHSDRFIRRVQTTKDEPIYEFFRKNNKHMCEKSVWSANDTDDVISFPIKAKPGSIVKEDLSALEHLQIIKNVQEHWVVPGGVNSKKKITNSVSCTVIVKEDEWDKVIDYIYENRRSFAAVSLLDYFGDKIYEQAPLEKVSTKKEKDKFNELTEKFVPVDYTKLRENQDDTTHVEENACAGGACLI